MATVTWQEDTRYFSGKCSMVLLAIDIRYDCKVCLQPIPEISGSVAATLTTVAIDATGDVT